MEKFFNSNDTVLITYENISRAYETVDTTIELVVGERRLLFDNHFDSVLVSSKGGLIPFQKYYGGRRIAVNPGYIEQIHEVNVDTLSSLIVLDPVDRIIIDESVTEAETRIDSLTTQ